MLKFLRRLLIKPKCCGGFPESVREIGSDEFYYYRSMVMEAATSAAVLGLENPKARVFTYSLVNSARADYVFRGMSNQQTIVLIHQAMYELSLVCGMKFVNVETGGHIRIDFRPKVDYDALAVYAGYGLILISSTRSVSIPNALTCIKHEVMHFLGIYAYPRSDSWGHCVDKLCILHINGTGRVFCDNCLRILISRFGFLVVRDVEKVFQDKPDIGGPQPKPPVAKEIV